MTLEELRQLVAEVKKRRSELDNVEVKAARGGTPKRLYEPFSAFANRTGGGVLLFGLDEETDFSVVGVGNAHRLQEEITHVASAQMEPALRPQFVLDEIDGETVVAAEIDEIASSQKPCFYKEAGLPKGAYLRVGNTNRQMTEYEVFGYLSSRGQPKDDEDIVPDATETVENLEEEHSTRNTRLMRMMEDMHIVENRGSGIKAILHAMQEANLEPPNFSDRRASFQVTFRNHTLMNPDAIAWLNHFANFTLTDRQRLALVYLRQHERITNNEYRRLNRVDTMAAGQELRGLVETGLVETQGVGRWTSYQLKVSPQVSEEQESQTDEEQILAYVRQRGSINNSECRDLLQVDLHRASHLLKKMHTHGLLRREGERRWTRYHLP